MTKVIATGAEEHKKVIYPLLREDKVDYVIDSVASLANTTATLASGNRIEFDVYTTKEIRIESVSAVTRQIAAAQSIVISGGGPVGSELAADIKLRNKGKKITIVQPNGTILTMMRHPLPELAQKHMAEINVDIVNNDRVVSHENGVVTLSSGKVIPCDLYIPAYPTGGNATFLSGISKDARGYAVVDDTFTVAGYQNVFALGDCKTQLKHHVKGASFMGKLDGPLMVAFGHSHPEGWGVGPDLPGCLGTCCWCCCMFGWPCSPPVGPAGAKGKSDFNASIFPKKGKGIAK
eukprot:gene31813-39298_t